MTTNLPPTTAACVIATAIVAGVTGYFIGQGASLGLFSSSSSSSKQNKHAAPKITPHDGDASDEEEEEYDESGSESESDADGGELASFKDNSEEVKLVLVVRTDLGMTKGGIIPNCLLFFSRVAEALTDVPPPFYRQNSRPMLPCYTCMLQILPLARAGFAHSPSLGKRWSGQDRAPDQIGGGSAFTSGAGDEPWSLRQGYSGCRTDSNCQWESDCVGGSGPAEHR